MGEIGFVRFARPEKQRWCLTITNIVVVEQDCGVEIYFYSAFESSSCIFVLRVTWELHHHRMLIVV